MMVYVLGTCASEFITDPVKMAIGDIRKGRNI